MRLCRRPPSKSVAASVAASERTMASRSPNTADESACQPKLPLKVRLGKRSEPRAYTRSRSARSDSRAARTSGRWARVSAGMPMATCSEVCGKSSGASSSGARLPGVSPNSTSSRYWLAMRSFSNAGRRARVCASCPRACSTSSSVTKPAAARQRVISRFSV